MFHVSLLSVHTSQHNHKLSKGSLTPCFRFASLLLQFIFLTTVFFSFPLWTCPFLHFALCLLSLQVNHITTFYIAFFIKKEKATLTVSSNGGSQCFRNSLDKPFTCPSFFAVNIPFCNQNSRMKCPIAVVYWLCVLVFLLHNYILTVVGDDAFVDRNFVHEYFFFTLNMITNATFFFLSIISLNF